MKNLATNLARLRRERGMTQEAMAEALGVAPQTISKWENGVNLPDISLLPVLADFFGVTLDMLFGRAGAAPSGNPDQAFEESTEAVRRVLAAALHDPLAAEEPLEESVAALNHALQTCAVKRTGIFRPQGVVYSRDAVGTLLLKRPEGGWHTLFESEGAARMIRLLNQADFRKAMATILRQGMTAFTLNTLCARCGVADLSAMADLLRESGLFLQKELQVDGQQVVYFELHQEPRLFALLAALTYAGEFADFQDVYYGFYGWTGAFMDR